MPRPLRLALAFSVLLMFLPAVTLARQTGDDPMWKLPAKGDYPSKSTVRSVNPTNVDAEQLFGGLNQSRYETLGRIDGRGWLQVALRGLPLKKPKSGQKHSLIWGYLVSYYPTAAQATAAVASNITESSGAGKALTVTGVTGQMIRATGGGQYFTIAAFSAGNVAVEQLCTTYTQNKKKFGSLLDQYCDKQINSLAALLVKNAAAATPQPTGTATP